jgi:hypothetical protein
MGVIVRGVPWFHSQDGGSGWLVMGVFAAEHRCYCTGCSVVPQSDGGSGWLVMSVFAAEHGGVHGSSVRWRVMMVSNERVCCRTWGCSWFQCQMAGHDG